MGDAINREGVAWILNGTFSLEAFQGYPKETLDVLEFLRVPYKEVMKQHDGVIAPAQVVETYKCVHENKSSSISGRHVGHYKAAYTNQMAVNIHSTMMSLPYQVGFSPKRWHHVVDVMLEKDVNNPKKHWLRIVALFESDYNQSLRIMIA